MTFAKAYSGLNDAEILELDRLIRLNTLMLESGFKGSHPSKRQKSNLAIRFPRILQWPGDNQY